MIREVVNFKYKHPENLSPKNKAKITRIYNKINNSVGFPIKAIKLRSESQRRKAISKYNEPFKNSKFIKFPFLSQIDNQNSKIKFQDGEPVLYNETANSITDIYTITNKDFSFQPKPKFVGPVKLFNPTGLKKFLKEQHAKPGVKRGKIITKDGDIYSNKVNSQTLNEYQDYVDYIDYLLDAYTDSVGQWLFGVQVTNFKD